MPNIALVLEYNGAAFSGWQSQPNERTVEDELKRVLSMVLREEIAVVHASGRTDAGVHAIGQVVNFSCSTVPDAYRLKRAVSSILRGELAIRDVREVPADFHARFSAKRKQYRYVILNRTAPPVLDAGRVWHVGRPLDIERMSRDASQLVGEHDFTSFRGADCSQRSPMKEIFSSSVTHEGEYVTYRVVGNGFLKQMVRTIVGTLVALNRGQLTSSSMREVMLARNRICAGETAPAAGLFLDWVSYLEGREGLASS